MREIAAGRQRVLEACAASPLTAALLRAGVITASDIVPEARCPVCGDDRPLETYGSGDWPRCPGCGSV